MGGAGLDALVGGVGNDTYVVDNIGDVITELAGEGTDWVRSTIDYTLGAALENLELAAGGLTGTGNGLANLLDGSVAQDILKGLAGADTLHGLAGNDLLDGGEGIDALFGGSGNDTYLVDNIADMVTELAGDGADWIRSTVNVTLGDNVEYLSLLAEGLTGAGNALANSLYGSAGMDVLNGLAGNDILKGYAGNDMLDGGVGLDRLEGGLGNDTYLVDNIGDLVVEAAGQGADWVRSNISCTLAANVEYLTLLAGGLTGSGNALANVMYGSIGNDIFRGLGGNDMLKGYRGNDRYEFGVGDGLDAIEDVDTTAGNSDVLAFLPGINHDQLWFAQSGNDLRVSVMGTADQVTVKGWFNGAAGQIESIQSGDGKALLNTAVQQLVTAMSAFAPHAAGATGLTSAEHAALDGIIAASWS